MRSPAGVKLFSLAITWANVSSDPDKYHMNSDSYPELDLSAYCAPYASSDLA